MTEQAMVQRESALNAKSPLTDFPPSVKRWTSDSYRPPRLSGIAGNGWVPPPAIDAETAVALPMLIAEREATLVPADSNAIKVELAALYAVMRKGDDGMTKGVVNIYAEDLAEFPLAVLHDACVAWRRREVFWPAIAEIRKECEGILAVRRVELRRLRMLQAVGENPAPDDGWVTDSWVAAITASAEAGEGPPRTAGVITRATRALTP